MKKIIKGKTYNTDTAIFIYQYASSSNYKDLDYSSESLYKKANGEFFIYYVGSPPIDNAYYNDNYWKLSNAEGIIPISEAEAKHFMEQYAEVEEYEKLFGKCEE